MTKIVKDRYGQQIWIGSKVAFNCSGEVCVGLVTLIQKTKRYGRTQSRSGEPYYKFLIRHQDSDDISVVTNRKSITNVK